MSKSTLPRWRGPISGYCWIEHPHRQVHCTLPKGHAPGSGGRQHWHPYTKTSW